MRHFFRREWCEMREHSIVFFSCYFVRLCGYSFNIPLQVVLWVVQILVHIVVAVVIVEYPVDMLNVLLNSPSERTRLHCFFRAILIISHWEDELVASLHKLGVDLTELTHAVISICLEGELMTFMELVFHFSLLEIDVFEIWISEEFWEEMFMWLS